ncbi:hypothetical protein BS17DRAFT_863839 [Gyrodon lividus]|nr:hypothetical protein BS17DRAFT_863839 [Gyrodon lividus]
MDASFENSESISEPASCRTRPGNANKHPARILFETGTIQKRCTKAEKAADDKRLKDTKAAQEQATQKGIEHLAMMEMEAEEMANEAKESKPQPAHLHPPLKAEIPGDGSLGQAVVKPAVPSSEVDPDVVITAKRIRRLSQSLKDAINDYKTHHVAGAKKANAVMPNVKENRKKFALGGQVKSWADNVAAEANKLGGTSTKQPSTTDALPPSTTVSKSSILTSLTGSSHSGNVEIFADAEKWHDPKSRKSDHELDAPLSQLRVASRSVKRKVDDVEVVSNSKPDESANDGAMEIEALVSRDVNHAAEKRHRTTTSTLVGIKINASTFPPQKKVKCEKPATLTPSVPSNVPASTSNTSMPAGDRNTETYIIDVFKKRADYSNKDLPVPSDQSNPLVQRSTEPNMWSVPEDELTSALDAIFKVVYPGIKYKVTTSGSVFSVTLQWLSKWQSGFGSTTLTMLIDFFSKLNDDLNIHGVAKDLMTSYAFLQEDPDFPQEEGMFCSTFLLELIGSTHLSNITGFVEVPRWDVQGMARGKNGEGIIAMALAALEHAVKFITKDTIDVKQVLADMANSPDGKMNIKLPKVLNKLTGRESSAPFQFSATHWNGDTAAYREAIQKRGQAFACSVFAAAQANKGTKSGTGSDADDCCTSTSCPSHYILLHLSPPFPHYPVSFSCCRLCFFASLYANFPWFT